MKKLAPLALAAGLTFSAGMASAATIFDFAGTSSPATTLDFTVDGIKAQATAATTTNGTTFRVARVTQANGGLGALSATAVEANDNAEIDGAGVSNLVLLSFEKVVKFLGFQIGAVDANGSDDWDVYVDYGTGTFTQIINDSTTVRTDLSGKSLVVKRVAFVADDADDDFRLRGVQVSAVPLPASALLLVGALGGLAALRRRKA